jgi:hypothetical protein
MAASPGNDDTELIADLVSVRAVAHFEPTPPASALFIPLENSLIAFTRIGSTTLSMHFVPAWRPPVEHRTIPALFASRHSFKNLSSATEMAWASAGVVDDDEPQPATKVNERHTTSTVSNERRGQSIPGRRTQCFQGTRPLLVLSDVILTAYPCQVVRSLELVFKRLSKGETQMAQVRVIEDPGYVGGTHLWRMKQRLN